MLGKVKSQRQVKKGLLRHIEDNFDVRRLEYKRRATPARHRAKLVGVVVAFVVYSFGFGLAYYAWKTGATIYETYMKFTWIFMLPSSVVGIFAYMLSSNRGEYRVAKDIMDYMVEKEGEAGLVWRYEPVLEALGQMNATARLVVDQSRAGDLARIEPEDYAAVVRGIYEALSGGEGKSISAEVVEAFEHNLAAV